jgi:acid phosphatase
MAVIAGLLPVHGLPWPEPIARADTATIIRAGVSSVANPSATNVVTVPKPAGTTAGDLLVACLATNGTNVSTGGAPAGWSAITVVSTLNNPKLFGYYRIAGLTEPGSYSWVLSASATNGAGIARYSGVDPTAPIDGAPASGSGLSGSPPSVPGVTAASAGAMLVGCLGINSGSTSVAIASPSGMSEAWDVGGKRHEFADELLPAAGPSGARAWSLSSGRDWVGWLAPLRPGTTPPDPTPTPTSSPGPTATASPSPTPSSPPATPTSDPGLAFHVSPSGDDLAPGTVDAPWQTLQHAVNVAPPGATISMADGAYPGATWTRSDLTVMGGPAAVISTPIVISGVTSATVRGLTVSTGTGVAGRSGLDVRDSSDVLLDGITVSGNSWGVELENVTASTLRDSALTDNALALEVKGAAAGVLISGNRIHDNTRFWATGRSATGVTFSYATGPLTVSNNVLHGNHAPSGSPADGVGIEIYASTGLSIIGNTLYDNLDTLETGTDLAQTPCGFQFTGNVVYKSTASAGESHGLILRCAAASQVANNTLDGLDAFAFDVVDGTLGTPYGGSIAGLVVRDNIVVGGRALAIGSALPASVSIDRDVLFNSGSTALYGQYLGFVSGLGNTSSLSELRMWGFEGTGLWADPAFVDRAGRDYHLRQASPAAGKGAFPVPGSVPGPTVSRFDHVFVVVEENKAYSQIIGSPDAPYWNFLASEGISLTDFRAVTHPSLPNYLALVGGDTFGLAVNCLPSDPGCSFDAPTLVDRMEDAGLTWRGYFEGMTTPCRTTNSGLYRVNHDPFVYFEGIRLDVPRCAAGVRPLGDLAIDLATNTTTPTLAFIVPDNCNNMHDCPVVTGDTWLRSVLPTILDSPAWAAGNALLILTFDEDDGSEGNRISTVLYGPDVRPHQTVSTTSDLYDLLRTLEDAWSLSPLTGNDGAATALSEAFRSAPSPDTTPPTIPGALNASAPAAGRVDLAWQASSDGTGVTAYEVYRDGVWLGWTLTTTYVDTSVAPSTTYGYRVRARDALLNVSGYSTVAVLTTPAADPSPSPSPTPSPSPSPTPSPSPGGIVRASVATVVNSSPTSLLTIGMPNGTTQGDVLVACLALNGGGVAANGVPIGWSTIATVTGVSNPRIFGYVRVAGASEPGSYTWTLSSAVKNGAGIARYVGVDPTQPLDGTPTTAAAASGTSATLPGVTTSTPNTMLVGCVGINSSSNGATITSPAGMTQAWDIAGKRHEAADGNSGPAGPTGPRTWTMSQSRAWGGWLVALRD